MSQQLLAISSSVYDVVDSMHDVESASSNMFDPSSLNNANSQLDATKNKIDAIENNIRQADGQQDKFNQSLQESHTVADGLNNRLMRVAATIGAVFGAGKIIGLSDEMTQTTARLDLMNYGLQTTEELQQMIFQSAQDSRGAYQTTADAVAKLGMQARSAFSGNEELVAFTEQLNKNFVVAGTSTQGVESVMLQLTQAMAAGKLQGEELNAVLDNAQPIVQHIADYMDVPVGKIKDLASEGQITAEIIKNAMFASADETNAKFAQMPMTWGQVANNIQNNALKAFQPILNKINEIANSTRFQEFSANVSVAISNIASVISEVFDATVSVVNFIADNWSIIGPIFYGVAAALIACSIASSIMAARQWFLNSALLACPISWIVLAIIALIAVFYSVVGAINKFAGTSLNATGMIAGAFAFLGAVVINSVLGVYNFIIGIGVSLYNLIATFANFFATVFNDPVSAIIHLFHGVFDTICSIVESAAGIIDMILGSNISDGIANFRNDLQNAVDDVASNQVEVMAKKNASDFQVDRIDYSDAYNAGNEWGSNIGAKTDLVAKNASGVGSNSMGNYDLSGTQAGKDLNDTAANTAAVAKSVSDSTEELKYLRDVAEREVVNRFTTAEIKVDMGGINNNVNSNVDLDGVVTYLEDKLNETLASTAEQYND